MSRRFAPLLIISFLSGCGDPGSAPTSGEQDNVSAPIEAIPSGTPLKLDISTGGKAARPTVYGKTNLPDGTRLSVMLIRKEVKFTAQAAADVKAGRFSAGPIGPASGLTPGLYRLSISSPISHIQPAEVQRIVGVDYENLTGPYFDEGGIGRSINREIEYRAPGKDTAQARAAALKERDADLAEWARQSCESIERMQGRATLTPSARKRIAACARRSVAP